MEDKYLHIIAFDIPDPPNYGGVIVVYYHIKALIEEGAKIILHNFQYGNRNTSEHLARLCETVYYYKRPKSFFDQLSQTPFIVKSRNDQALLKNLEKDAHPILFEGVHTCAFIGHKQLSKRKKIVRMHNIEWQYYRSLAGLENNPFKKIYFYLESRKLKVFDRYVLRHADLLLCLSPNDTDYYKKLHQAVYYMPVFHPNNLVTSKKGKGDYILFHGNLGVKDNEQAARFLIEKIAPQINLPIIIAGLSPSVSLIETANQYVNVTISANVSEQEMDDLLRNAHINFLWTYQAAGMKLKLLNALYKGRFCLTNKLMVENTGLEELCWVCKNAEDSASTILHLFEFESFSDTAIQQRKTILEYAFSNIENAKRSLYLYTKINNAEKHAPKS